MPIAAIAAIGAVGSIGGAAIGAHAAGSAANTQANAALQAAQLQKQAADDSLAFQKDQFNYSKGVSQPWLTAGQGALANLSYLLGIPMPSQGANGANGGAAPISMTPNQPIAPNSPPNQLATAMNNGGDSRMDLPADYGAKFDPGMVNPTVADTGGGAPTPNSTINPGLGNFGDLSKGWTEQFNAPTGVTEQNDPGFQARLKMGMDVLQKSAAARGGVLSGGTLKDLNQYGQDYASNEYGNVYNRAWNEYANRYNTFEGNQANLFNRLGALSGVGQVTANQLGMMGQNFANNSSNILMQGANAQAQGLNNAAAARASGYVGAGNAWGGAVNGLTSNITNLLLMKNLFPGPSMNQGGGNGTIGVTG